MRPLDYARAAGVAFIVLVGTLLFSIPMVAVYSWLIEPGHPPEFYTAAAQWIAPWSSHILGPILFFWLNYRAATRNPQRNAIRFALFTFLWYLVIDGATLPLFGVPLRSLLNLTLPVSLAVKAVAALLGAHLGARASVTPHVVS